MERSYTTIRGIGFELPNTLQQVPKPTVQKQETKKKAPKIFKDIGVVLYAHNHP